MRPHIQTPAEQTKQQNPTSQRTAQFIAEPQTTFDDNRPETAQLRAMQTMMGNSLQQQRLQALQAKMHSSPQIQRMQALQAQIAVGTITQPRAAPGAEEVQRVEEEKSLQAKPTGKTAQREASAETLKPNNTGLPSQLKAGIESLSGMNMDHVKVHYNSDKPAQLNAHAYAQGSEIHVAAGQEQHLPHEAWHVVQQAQGRVKPTMQMKGGVQINEDAGLETEADLMGGRALSTMPSEFSGEKSIARGGDNQCKQLVPNRVHVHEDANRYQVGYSDLVGSFMGGAAPGPAARPTPASYNAQYVREDSNGTQVQAYNVNVAGNAREYHRGHMLADAMGGGGGYDNIFQQDGGQNTTGAWPAWERTVANDMANAPPDHSATIAIELIK